MRVFEMCLVKFDTASYKIYLYVKYKSNDYNRFIGKWKISYFISRKYKALQQMTPESVLVPQLNFGHRSELTKETTGREYKDQSRRNVSR